MIPVSIDPKNNLLSKHVMGTPQYDSIVNTVLSIEKEHGMIHAGLHYICTDFNSSVGTGSNKDYLIVVPNNNISYHMLFECDSFGEVLMSIAEDATVSGNGSAMNLYNSDRTSINVATLAVYSGPTVTGTGNVLKNFLTGSGSGTAIGAGSTTSANRSAHELILNNGHIYLLRYHNQSGTVSADIAMRLTWYET
jgi:hypothetical protein